MLNCLMKAKPLQHMQEEIYKKFYFEIFLLVNAFLGLNSSQSYTEYTQSFTALLLHLKEYLQEHFRATVVLCVYSV